MNKDDYFILLDWDLLNVTLTHQIKYEKYNETLHVVVTTK